MATDMLWFFQGDFMTSAAESALAELQAGNARYVAGERQDAQLTSGSRRNELLAGQKPKAIILGCSDSRVPAELVFDQGLGDLFVIRNAGNIVAPSQIGSVEFAVEQFETPLVVVMGHTQCGAIKATVEQLQAPADSRSTHLGSIVQRIRPAVATLLETSLKDDTEALMSAAGRANVRASVSALRHGSRFLEEEIYAGRLLIVGAEYSLETGAVEFFDYD